MSWYLVELRYVPDKVDQARQAHRDYIVGLVQEGRVGFAGRYADNTSGLFLFRADSPEELVTLMDNDPYYTRGATSHRSSRAFEAVVAVGLTGDRTSEQHNGKERDHGRIRRDAASSTDRHRGCGHPRGGGG
jgi:uncharacterized protein